MKIRKVRQIEYITINQAPTGESEYIGESFEVVDSSAEDLEFKDWLNGNYVDGFTRLLSEGFSYGELKTGYDIKIFEDSVTTREQEVVAQKLTQRLFIQYNELNYDYEITDNLGIPYLNKKTKEEMDLIFRREILRTPGVKRIDTFNSKVENGKYILNFKVISQGGESIWLQI